MSSGEQLAQLVVQQRIIIRTVDMGVEVDDVGVAIDDIGEMAKRMGGWIVSSNRPLMHTGSVSVRVPADMLDQAVLEIRALSLRVQYESSDSRDVTDEYVDLSSRLKNTMATEEALLKLLERAEKVDDALAVQSNLSRVQEEEERLQGRIKYLEQTSAYSLLNVSLSEEPREMVPDAGPDVRAGVGEPVRFRASFTPPDGIESFDYTWDFGDGTQVVGGNRTAPTGDGSRRVTATVHHRYEDERDSPYIVQFNITGFGDGGLSEGEDTLIATVSRIPNIEVFAGEWVTAEEGETVELSGSFTRPAGMTDMRYTWDFGDGSSPETGSLEEGVTTVVAAHIYANYRPRSYTARLTITGTMETGEVEGSSTVDVQVRESQGWVIGGWSFEDQWKTAVRTLSAVAAAALTGSIWLLVFSPIIAAIVAAAIFLGRRAGSASAGSRDANRRRGTRKYRAPTSGDQGEESPHRPGPRGWPVTRHFTATGFVVHRGRVALHWHPKVKAWLPPGGHIEANEDPVQAVLREIEEETGLGGGRGADRDASRPRVPRARPAAVHDHDRGYPRSRPGLPPAHRHDLLLPSGGGARRDERRLALDRQDGPEGRGYDRRRRGHFRDAAGGRAPARRVRLCADRGVAGTWIGVQRRNGGFETRPYNP